MFEIGKIIKDARKKAGLTQEELGRMVDRTQDHIGRIECGRGLPSPKLFEALVNVLGISFPKDIKDLVSGSNPFKDDLLADLIQDIKFLTEEDVKLFRKMVKNTARKNKLIPPKTKDR